MGWNFIRSTSPLCRATAALEANAVTSGIVSLYMARRVNIWATALNWIVWTVIWAIFLSRIIGSNQYLLKIRFPHDWIGLDDSRISYILIGSLWNSSKTRTNQLVPIASQIKHIFRPRCLVLTIELTFLTVIGQWMNIQFNVLYLIRKLINTEGMMDVTVTINYSLNRRLTIASQVRLLSHYIFSVRDLLLIDSWTNHVLMSWTSTDVESTNIRHLSPHIICLSLLQLVLWCLCTSVGWFGCKVGELGCIYSLFSALLLVKARYTTTIDSG